MALVMVVDDLADVRDLLAKILAYSGHTALKAASGEEALSLLATERPDVMLLDISMPDMNGFQVLERLRTLPDDRGAVPVLMMTAMSDPDSVDRATRLGARGYFVKGTFDISSLLKAIASHAESPKPA